MLKNGVKVVADAVSRVFSFVLRVDTAFQLQIKAVTRLGDIPLKGVKIKINDEEFGSSDEKGEFRSSDGEMLRKSVDANEVIISGSYKNTLEKLREEMFRVALSEIDVEQKSLKAKMSYKIPKVRNAPGDGGDVDFETEYEKLDDLLWTIVDDVIVLELTVRLCTFSLMMPYMNQRSSHDTVCTRPGLEDRKDPEAEAHAVRGPTGNQMFMGGKLCYPTSVKMLLEYWAQARTRAEVMQQCYDQWAEDGFVGRLDKINAVEISNTPPTNLTQGKYWLDSSLGDAQGYTMKRAIYEFKWRLLTDGAYSATYTQETEPDAPKEEEVWKKNSQGEFRKAYYALEWILEAGTEQSPQYEQDVAPEFAKELELWKDTSQTPPIVKKGIKKLRKDKIITEEDWRVKKWNGSAIWEYGEYELRAIETFKPAGRHSRATANPIIYDEIKKGIDIVPLTRLTSDDAQGPMKAIDDKYHILDEYKQWLRGGWPFIISTTATAGHMMVVRGLVLNKNKEIEWLIVNDPFGNMEDKIIGYDMQSERNTTDGAGSDRGRHAYYRNDTAGKYGNLRIKAGGRGFPRIEKKLTGDEIAKRLVVGIETD